MELRPEGHPVEGTKQEAPGRWFRAGGATPAPSDAVRFSAERRTPKPRDLETRNL